MVFLIGGVLFSPMKKSKDNNIIGALKKLQFPIKNVKGIDVYLREEARSETGEEHIAAKKHFLKVRDINCIASIIKNPLLYKKDPKRKKSMVYFGKRSGKEKAPYLKIVTNIRKDGNEEIITVYPKKKLK